VWLWDTSKKNDQFKQKLIDIDLEISSIVFSV
jgi:hypothetical protein